MKLLCAALLLASARGLVPLRTGAPRSAVKAFADESPVGSSPAETSALVPINEETIASSASVTTGVVGYVIGGPVFAVLTAIAGNYAVKRDGEVGDVIRGFGKVSLDVFNFLLKLNGKYDLTSKASVAAKSAVDKLKESDSDGTLGKLETSLAAATAKLSSLDMEFGLVEKGKQVLGYAGDLSVKAIDKSIELNSEYKLTDKVTEAVKAAATTKNKDGTMSA
mmetsp:Transcript_12668/g.43755  ORF Transcript_12668/g.43755 Transcript_12668/m.43755 type:complete len:222 (-) Transcript_12668:95-760(-)